MRSLKECYGIAKKYHAYWTGDSNDTRFMCYAMERAYNEDQITLAESIKTSDDIMSIVEAHDTCSSTLIEALGCAYGKDFTDKEVKAYWDKYIDTMENQDG